MKLYRGEKMKSGLLENILSAFLIVLIKHHESDS